MHTAPPTHEKPKTWQAGTLIYTSGGLVMLFLWLLWGDFAWSMRDRSIGPMAQWYLNHLNVSNLLFGLLISSFPALIGLIFSPIVAVKSDRHRGRFGRRIPFLLITTPIAAFGMIGIGLTPVFAAWLHHALSPTESIGLWLQQTVGSSSVGAGLIAATQNEVLVALILFGIFWAGFEFATITSQTVFSGLINDVVPRAFLGRFYGLFRAVSLIDGMLVNFWIIGHVPTHFTVILISIGSFYGIAFLWVCFKVKEGDYPPPPPPPDKRGLLGGFKREVKGYCSECFSNGYYVAIFLFLMAAALAFAPLNTFAIPYARSLNVNMEVYGKFLALTYLISFCLSFFLGWLADLLHPLRLAMATLACYIVVTVLGSLYATDATSFLALWVVHGILSGCYFTSSASLAQRLFPHAKFAQFASAAAMFTAFGNMIIGPAMGTIIDLSNNVYRYTFTAGFVLTSIALLAAWYAHARFMRLGGVKNYRAPE